MTGGTSHRDLTVMGGRLFFTAQSASGRELWVTQPGADTATLVKDLNPGPADGVATQPVAFGGRLFFVSDADPSAGSELWNTDGTAAGTGMVQDLTPGVTDGAFGALFNGGDGLYFSGNDGVRGFEPYRLADTFGPAAWESTFDHRGPSRVAFHFTEDASADLAASDLIVTNQATGERVPPESTSVSYDSATHTATFTFPGYPGGVLPNGDYRASLPAGAVKDSSNNPSAAEAVVDFFVLTGDVNRNRAVNGSDFAILAGNFGKTGMTYGQGDLNADGAVNGADFALLAGNFGKTVPASGAAAAAVSETRSLEARSALRADDIVSTTNAEGNRPPFIGTFGSHRARRPRGLSFS